MTLAKKLLGRFNSAIDIFVLLLVPAFLCIVVPDWIFSPIATIDPWVYVGYSLNFTQYATIFSGTYYGTRLPFIIPGFISYHIFPPIVANYVLHLGFYYMALFSLYFILRVVAGRRSALITSVILGFYPYFMAATGWDYIDGAGIAYFLLTALLLTLAAKSLSVPKTSQVDQRQRTNIRRFSILLFLAGMSLAALVYTNTYLFIMVPSLALYYLILCPYRHSLLLKNGLLVLYGLISATVLFGLISVAAGGSFLFFIPSFLNAAYYLVIDNPWLIPGYGWLLHVPFLVFPFFIFLTSLFFLIKSLIHLKYNRFQNSSIQQAARDNIFGICHLLNFLIMSILQMVGKQSFQIQYYASYLLPTAFMAAGAQLSFSLSRLTRNWYVVLITVMISLLAGSYLLFYQTPLHELTNSIDNIWYLTAVLVIGLLCLMAANRRQILNATLATLAMAVLALTPVTLLATNSRQIAYCACDQRLQNFQAVIESDDIISSYDTTDNLYFWYNSSESLGGLYKSIASTRLWGYRLINDKFPALSPPDFPGQKNTGPLIKMPPGVEIVILSRDSNALSEANAALYELGLQASLVRVEEIRQGPINFKMTFIRIEAR